MHPPTFMNSHIKTILLAISTSLALPLLDPAPSSAISVTIGSFEYEVLFFDKAYTDPGVAVNFQLPPLGTMPWFLSDGGTLASSFATQVFNLLGDLTPSASPAGYGPIFAFELNGTDIQGLAQNVSDINFQQDYTIPISQNANYAYVTSIRPILTSVPAPLPLFGAAAAFGWCRQLRKRLGSANFQDHFPMS